MMGGTAEGNAAARADSWPKLLKFLRTNLAAPAGVPQ
jgi:dienelactone hydrolase